MLYRLSLYVRKRISDNRLFYTSIFYKRNTFGGGGGRDDVDGRHTFYARGKTARNSLATWYCALRKPVADIVLYSYVVRRVRGQTITSTVWFIIVGELIVLTRITFRRTASNGLRLITGLGFYPRRSWI